MKQRLAASYAISLLVIFLVVLNAPASTLINSVGTGTLRNDYNGTVGYEFTVGSTPLYVSELGYFDNNNDGLNTAHNVGLWNSFGELVATATVSAGTGATLSGGFRWATLATPLALPANATYRVGALVNTSGDYWRNIGGGASLNTPLVTTTWSSKHSNVGTTLVYPTFNAASNDGFMAPNLSFASSPRQYRITPVNAGFENPTLGDGNFIYTTPSAPTLPGGWTNNAASSYRNAGILNPSTSMYASGNAPEGNNVLWAYSDSTGSTEDSIVAQIINLTLEANMIYTLTVNVGDRLDTPNNGYAVRLGYGSSLGSFTLLAQDNNSLALPNGGWVTSTVVYTNLTAIAQPLQIQLVGLKGPGSGNQVNFDNVQLLVTMIPEPSTIFLFVSGLATLYWAWRRRHSRGATGE